MKYHQSGAVLFVSSAIREGLLLLSNSLSLAIIWSYLAAAQKLYSVGICHLLALFQTPLIRSPIRRVEVYLHIEVLPESENLMRPRLVWLGWPGDPLDSRPHTIDPLQLEKRPLLSGLSSRKAGVGQQV